MTYRDKRNWIRCNECRTRRSTAKLMLLHLKLHLECRPCTCGGYHYAHRKGSPQCDFHPRGIINKASRMGASDQELAELEQRWLIENQDKDIPF